MENRDGWLNLKGKFRHEYLSPWALQVTIEVKSLDFNTIGVDKLTVVIH